MAKGLLVCMIAVAFLLPATRAEAYQAQIKRYGTLIDSTDRYQIYLSPFLTCESYDFGRGREHWMRAAAIFQRTEALPLQADFEIFFSSVLLPKVRAAAPAACKTDAVNLTKLDVDFYFLDYEPKDQGARLKQGVVAEAYAIFKDGRWLFHSDGDATMAAAQAAERELTEKLAAESSGKPYGEALKWIQASTASKTALPPGASATKLIGENDDLAVYAGDGYSDGLCEASFKRAGDYFLNLTLVFSADAVVPGKTRAEYEGFFEKLYGLLESRCPNANIASVVHYMRGQSHPDYFDRPYLNRIRLQRYETGHWKISDVDTGSPIFVSAADIALYRQARSNPRASNVKDGIYFWALAKLLFAAMAEGVRRQAATNDESMAQLLSTLGRDGLIASALSDFFPEARKQELQYMTRYVGLAMSGRLTPANIAQGTAREYLLQQLEKEDVMAGHAARFVDLLIDLESQRSAKPSEH